MYRQEPIYANNAAPPISDLNLDWKQIDISGGKCWLGRALSPSHGAAAAAVFRPRVVYVRCFLPLK